MRRSRIFIRGGEGPGPMARIQDPHMGYTHTHARTHIHTCSCIDGKLRDIQIDRNMHKHVQR